MSDRDPELYHPDGDAADAVFERMREFDGPETRRQGVRTMKIINGKEAEYAKYVETNSQDGYSKGVVDYAERWADLMERAVARGENIKDVAKTTSHDADTDGITGFMYGCAVSALAHFWVHGEELRRWHNLDTQIAGEGAKANETGGVLNPAVLTINVPGE